MRIQHNIMAMNSYRNYTNNTNALAKNIEKLSSGYKINRAGDDAAGLAISEKMRAQITGLTQAQQNAKDGISLVQTAEGAMQEIHDMLNRMVKLATQSANGTYEDTVDRHNLQKEVEALKAEIDRISDSSNFNGINLIDGSLSASGSTRSITATDISGIWFDTTAAVKGEYEIDLAAADFFTNIATDIQNGDKISYTFSYQDTATGNSKSVTIELTAEVATQGNEIVLVGGSGERFVFSDGFASNLPSTATTAQILAETQREITNCLATEIRNSALGNVFNVSSDGANGISLEARKTGSDGAVLLGVSIAETHHNSTTGVPTYVTRDLAAGTLTTVAQAADSYKFISSEDIVMWNGTDNLDKATFEINGQKFVFVDSDAGGYDKKDLPSDVTLIEVDMSAATIIEDENGAEFLAFDRAIADAIAQKTGLIVEVDAGRDDGHADGYEASKLIFRPNTTQLAGEGGLSLLIGDTADSFNKLQVSIEDMHVSALGIANIDISKQQGAEDAIQMIKDAINLVSDNRGTVGALQNRLEHTINNLSVMTENIQDAESTIRDTDVAEEMMAYAKNNILVQSAQAMLAQANQIPQGVLQLLG